MKKMFEAKKNFWIGEINKEMKSGVKVEYDPEKNSLVLHGQKYEVRNLKAAIKAQWLVPLDGVYPELDGPVGETEAQANERRRKQRFAEQAKEDSKKLKADTREVNQIKKQGSGCVQEGDKEFVGAMGLSSSTEGKRVGTSKKETSSSKNQPLDGCFPEGTDKYFDALGVDHSKAKPKRGEFKVEVQKDDSKVVSTAKVEDKEVKSMKKALRQEPKHKDDAPEFKVFTDSFDDGSVQVGTYTSDNINQIKQTWSGMHWTKKEDIIKKASKDVLKELKGVEPSKKIKARIQKRLDEELAV